MRLFCAVLLWFAVAAAAAAQPVRTERVEAELHSSRAAVVPGERFTIVLRQNIREHWHTYWRNPGDSGEPTDLTWRAPTGWHVGPIQWPAPEAIPFAMLVNYGYSNEVLFPIEVTAPADARPGDRVTLTADAYWLVCSDICVPEEATLTLTLPVATQGRDDTVWGPRVAQALEALPRPAPGVDARIAAGPPAHLSVALPGAEALRNPRFFPYSRDAMEAAQPQRPRVGPAGLSFTLSPGVANDLGETVLEGVVVYEAREGGGWVRRGVEIAAQPGEAIPGVDDRPATISDDYPLAELERGAGAGRADAAMPAATLIAALALAFLGGVILNVMPCVLPVLSVKALAFAGGMQRGDARRHGTLYFAGVMATFLALAVVLIGLRGAGEVVGWGFQLQAPWVTAALALLFFAIGLNLLGVFQIGAGAQNVGAGLSARGGDAGAFFTGALAVIAATPCAAPFMATAVGAALLSQSAAVTVLILGAMGVGFALPLTALHFAPGLQRLVPRPGVWMERVRNVLAFPMFAAAVWLAWVLTEQTGPMGVLALLSIAAALAFALFVGRWGRAWAAAGLVALVLTGVFTWRPLLGVQSQDELISQAWTPALVTELRNEGRGVFVNFTAAWCVTCKVNEATSLRSARVARAFGAANIAYLEADWTNRDDTIAAALAEHGRAGVPLYLYYPPGDGAVVLPQMLSERLILEAIGGDPQ